HCSGKSCEKPGLWRGSSRRWRGMRRDGGALECAPWNLPGAQLLSRVLVNEGMVVRREPGARFALLAAFKFCPGARTNLAIIVLSQQCAAREPYRMRRHRAFSGVRTPQP